MTVGFGVAGGAEAAVHTTQKCINDACPHDIMIKNDMQNAFNSLRRIIYQKCVTTCQEICRLVHCDYSIPSILLIGNEIIASSPGVQQGDPHGQHIFFLRHRN